MNNGIQNLDIAKPRVTFAVLIIIEFSSYKRKLHLTHSKIDFSEHAPRKPKLLILLDNDRFFAALGNNEFCVKDSIITTFSDIYYDKLLNVFLI